jgi:hypothetical protein
MREKSRDKKMGDKSREEESRRKVDQVLLLHNMGRYLISVKMETEKNRKI